MKTAQTTGSANYPQWGLSWTYDPYGNRLSQSQTYDGPPTSSVTVNPATNRITDRGNGYDANGNMTNDGLNTLTYDGENRVVSSATGGTTSSYTYDGNNLRVKKQVGSATATVYIFSGSKVVAEYAVGAGVGSPTREYIYSGSTLLATIEGSTTKYHHADHLSVRVTSDTSGNVLGQQGHYPFGEQWYPALPQSPATKWQFTSYERDGGTGESGNDYAIARLYVNRLGRYSSRDPVAGSPGDPQSLNRYAYVRNNPINLTDPLGLYFLADPVPEYSGTKWGNTMFDAIHGSPGMWFDFDMHGNLQWGFSIDLWQSQMAALEGGGDPGGADISKDCADALKTAGGNKQGLQNVKAQWATLQAIGFANGLYPAILGAIGTRETNFRNITGDFGHGHGVFQIDDRYHPREAATIAYDVDLAANFAAGLVVSGYSIYSGLGYSPAVALAAALRDYNGTGGIPTSTILSQGGSLDSGTTGGNYASNVLAIALNCF